jgi:1-acyl-sn-glycerol-3-phosphate acyltransferase
MRHARARDTVVTVALWSYFIGAFVAGYWIVFAIAGLLRGQRGLAWALASYLRCFFAVIRLLVPRARFSLPPDPVLAQCRGTVVVCNHLSFLDPLLLVAHVPRATTIVRPDFFRVPIFGWLLRGVGFLGPDLFTEGQAWVARVARHLRRGGNLIVFPEGTRSRDGSLGGFKKGAFYLAKHLAAPILVLRVLGTERMFPPGQWRFSTVPGQGIEVRALARLAPTQTVEQTTYELTNHVRGLYQDAPPAPAASTGGSGETAG